MILCVAKKSFCLINRIDPTVHKKIPFIFNNVSFSTNEILNKIKIHFLNNKIKINNITNKLLINNNLYFFNRIIKITKLKRYIKKGILSKESRMPIPNILIKIVRKINLLFKFDIIINNNEIK